MNNLFKFILEDTNTDNSDFYMEKVVTMLKLHRLYNTENRLNLIKVKEYYDKGLIDLSLFERGFEKILRLKGSRKLNVSKFFNELLKSLENRRLSIKDINDEPEYFTLEPQEPSILPKKIYREELYYLQIELLKLQEWLNKTGKTVIIVFEGRDSAGKGTTIKKFTENMNPRYYNVIALGIPTPEERKNWWDRYRSKIQKGKINLLDRSWYNRGLIEPLMGYGEPEEYEDFMNNVEDFENDLVKDGDYLFKLWFSIDKETQAKRFEMRQQSPLKYWKYSPNDEKMQDLWDRFTEFKEKLFDKTSTINHPWIVVDSNDKRISGLNAIRYVLQNIPYENKNEKILSQNYPEALSILRPKS
jgi:polyphosphate kinase 2